MSKIKKEKLPPVSEEMPVILLCVAPQENSKGQAGHFKCDRCERRNPRGILDKGLSVSTAWNKQERLRETQRKGKVVTTEGKGRLEAIKPDFPRWQGKPLEGISATGKNKADSAGQQQGEQDRTVHEWRQKDWLKRLNRRSLKQDLIKVRSREMKWSGPQKAVWSRMTCFLEEEGWLVLSFSTN